MANFNKVILIGNLTRDPECRTFGNGGKVANFGIAVNHKRKNTQTGLLEDEPMFIDCEAFNWGERGTLANIVEQYCRKGGLVCLEGRLRLDQWDDKTTGAKRSKHKLVVESLQLLGSKADGQGGGGGAPRSMTSAGASAPPQSSGGSFDDEPHEPHNGNEGDKIPF
jgi:single-strand DNA-binding protein